MLRPILLGGCLSLALAACASTGTVPPPRAAAPSGLPLGCVPNAQTQRCDQFGTYYSGDDLRATGAQHVGQALILLDPQLGH
ncbi:MAG TPA: hypothetical protein VM713_08635 [Steroidobacteraceae bacterium]|nr:hypothetical protein [Steroidobacteraceae bacterium]